jgi:general secretion pathway protein D
MTWGKWLVVVWTCALAACGQAPLKPAANHITAEDARAEGSIPEPVQVTPLLPKPKATVRPETYSVVVNNVRAQELLFALARDARLQIDIDPNLTGNVTLNAIDQTLPQLLNRIARQIDMRYELEGDTLVVMRDAPFLRSYKIDYVSASRNVKMQSTASTQFGASGGAGAAGSNATGATSTIDVAAQNNLWESIVQNVKDILRETDRVIPASPPAIVAPAAAAAPASGTPGAQPPIPAPTAPAPTTTYQEAASVIANRESGVLYVRATAKQHERVQEFIDQVLAGAKRQVLIEATVAEVQLRNQYQRGIEWSRISQSGNFRSATASQGTFTNFSPSFQTGPFTLGFLSVGNGVNVTLKLLEQFGDVRVLSSPKLSVLNNQTAILRVTRDIIYFTIVAAQGTVNASGSGTVVTQPTFNTTPTVAAEGFMMAVLPQINASDAVVLNVRPTIRRQVAEALDPNPALKQFGTENRIPVFETREFDSILRLQSGQTGVLAGLMQDIMDNTDTFIPGIRNIPILGDILSNRNDLTTKTELVIFLRATVIRDPSVEGDFASLRNQLPREDFMTKPNPGIAGPMVGPDTRSGR